MKPKLLVTAAALASLSFVSACGDDSGPTEVDVRSSTSTVTSTTPPVTPSTSPVATTTVDDLPSVTQSEISSPEPDEATAPELDFDLEGDPCEGVSSVEVDGVSYVCVGDVFRKQ